MKYKETDFYLMRAEEIDAATSQNYRQYFCGNLKRPQLLDFIQTEDLEIGTSKYAVFSTDEPHLHSHTPDLVYILSGEFHVMLLSNKEIFVLKQGDFISIPPNTPYASKAKANTQTLFIKRTKGNDKVSVKVDDYVQHWLDTEI